MGRIRFAGRPGKRTDANGKVLGNYLDTLTPTERKKILVAYGLEETDDLVKKKELITSTDVAVVDEATEFISRRPKRNVKPIQRLSPNEPTPLPSTAVSVPKVEKRTSYEVDWNLTKELHDSLSLGIVRDQLKASSKSRASKQLNGLEKKHPSAICGVLCRDVTNEPVVVKNENKHREPPLLVRLKCFPKASPTVQSPALSPVQASPEPPSEKESPRRDSPVVSPVRRPRSDRDSSTHSSPVALPESLQQRPRGRGARGRSRSRARGLLVAGRSRTRIRGGRGLGRNRLFHNHIGYLHASQGAEDADHGSPQTFGVRRGRGRGGPRTRGPGSSSPRGRPRGRRGRGRPVSSSSHASVSKMETRTGESEEEREETESNESPLVHAPSGTNGHLSPEESECEEAMEVDHKSDDGSAKLYPTQSRGRGGMSRRGRGVRRRGRGSRGGLAAYRARQAEAKQLSANMETLYGESPPPSSSGKQSLSGPTPEPIPCEICEQVNKQRPVFYFHGHQVCRVCSNFLTSTLRKLTALSDAACIYRNTCDAAGRYCRACRLHKFLRLGFDLPKFSKMRGYPAVVNDLNLEALALPAVMHAARLDRFSEYAKFLENWRAERGLTLEFAANTPIPAVSRTPPPVIVPPPVKHRRPVWCKEDSSDEEEEQPSVVGSEHGFDTLRAIRLAEAVPFSCDICENRASEGLFRVDDKATICFPCLKRFQSLVTADSPPPTCNVGDKICEDATTCESCFFERCRERVSPAVVNPCRQVPAVSSRSKAMGPRTKSLFELRLPGDVATATDGLCCVICRLKAASTDGQLAFYNTDDKVKTEGIDAPVEEQSEVEVVCECCLWIYRWRVGEARAVEELLCPNERSCTINECYACLVQKCRTILPLFQDLNLPDWMKSVVFERLPHCTVPKKESLAGSDAMSDVSAEPAHRRVCKVKNATLPPVRADQEDETATPGSSEDFEEPHPPYERVPVVTAFLRGSRGRSRGRGRGMARGLGRGRGRRGRGRGWSRGRRGSASSLQALRREGAPKRGRPSAGSVRTKMPSSFSSDDEAAVSSAEDSADDFDLQSKKTRKRKRTFQSDFYYSDSEEDEEEEDDDVVAVDSRRRPSSAPLSGSDDDSGSLSEDGTRVRTKGNIVTMTRIVRAGGTKGPRIKQVSRHAATVFSRATKDDEEGTGRSKQVARGKSASSERTAKQRSLSHDSERLTEEEGDSSLDFDANESFNFVAPPEIGRNRSVSRRKGCGRCGACHRREDCGKCVNCRLMTKASSVNTVRGCMERICRQRRSLGAEVEAREQPGDTAWVTRLQERAESSHSNKIPPPPINKISGAPPSNTLWNTVPNLSRHIEEASCNAVYGDQEMERIHYNFAERQATNLAWDGGVAVVTTRKSKPPGELCYLCGSAGPHKMIHCVSCSEPFHWFCLEYADRPRSTAETVIWLCRNCKPCLLCHHTGGVLTCVTCWKGFHARCLPGYAPAQQPNRNAWQCPGCAVCSRCGNSAAELLPSSGTVVVESANARVLSWSQDPSQCAACERGGRDGNACPVCQRVYTDDDQEMIQCSHCSLWVHARCAGLFSEDYHALSRMNPRQLSKLIFCCRRCEQHTGTQKRSDSMQVTARNELRSRVKSLFSQLATREQEMKEETRAIEEGFTSNLPDDSQNSSMEVGEDDRASSPPLLPVPQIDGIVDDFSSQGTPEVATRLECPSSDGPDDVEIDINLPIEGPSHKMPEPAASPVIERTFLQELSYRVNSAEPGDAKDPLRFGLKTLISRAVTEMENLARSDNFGLQYQTYTQLLNDFEGYLSQQLPWFDLTDLRRKLRSRIRRRYQKRHGHLRKHSTDLDASSDSSSDSNDSDSGNFAAGPPVVELRVLESVMDKFATHVLESDQRWMNYWFRYDRHVNNLKEASEEEEEPLDGRECVLCRLQGEFSLAGRLLYCGQDVWIHANCALWSNEVYETEEGSLRHVGEAVLRGGQTFCRRCHGRGASLTCCGGNPSCGRSYHFLCGVRSDCIFTVDRAFYCRKRHAAGVDSEEVLNFDDLAVCRRVVIHREGFRPRKQWTQGLRASQIQLAVGALFVEYLGRVDEASDSLNCFLCPVGLRCTRHYWSPSQINTRIPYRLTVRQTNIAATGSPPAGARVLKRNGFQFNMTTAHHAKGNSVRIVPISPRQVLAETSAAGRREEEDVPSLATTRVPPGATKILQPSHPVPAPLAAPVSQDEGKNRRSVDTLADRLQRMSRQMMEQKRVQSRPSVSEQLSKMLSGSAGESSARTDPSTGTRLILDKYRSPPKNDEEQQVSPSTSAGIAEEPRLPVIQSVTNSCVQMPPPPVPGSGSSAVTQPSSSTNVTKALFVHRPPETKPLITSVRSLADAASSLNPAPDEVFSNRFRTLNSSKPVTPALLPSQDQMPSEDGARSESIWKPNSSLPTASPMPRVIPSSEIVRPVERAVRSRPKPGDLKRLPGPSLMAPDGKRLRLMAPVGNPGVRSGVAASNQVVMTRRICDGKTLFVCVNSSGVCKPVPGMNQPTISSVKGVGCAQTYSMDRMIERMRIPPPQVDGCMDEDDSQESNTARKDPPKRKTRWIEERDQKDKWKAMFAMNAGETKKRRRKNGSESGDSKARASGPNEHMAAISRAKRKHDERRYRQATADVQDNFWLTFTVEGSGIAKRICTLSPKLSWKEVTGQVKSLRYANRWRHPYIFGVDGWSQWGLNHRHLSYLVEQMEGAYMGYRHRFIYHRKKIESLRELNAPPVPCKRGCARVEPYPREAWRLHETFSFLLCSINKMGAYFLPSQGMLTGEEDNTGFSSTSSSQAKLVSQPLATRLRLHSCRRGRDVDVYRSSIHCRGLFAMRSFVHDEIIIEYLGEVIRSIVCEERERRYQEAHVDCFMFRIDADWVIDATMKGNAARFINHSCEPNCYSRVITMPDSSKHIVILASKDIERGEEVTYDYKFPAEDDKIPCHCGAQNCRRYLN